MSSPVFAAAGLGEAGSRGPAAASAVSMLSAYGLVSGSHTHTVRRYHKGRTEIRPALHDVRPNRAR